MPQVRKYVGCKLSRSGSKRGYLDGVGFWCVVLRARTLECRVPHAPVSPTNFMPPASGFSSPPCAAAKVKRTVSAVLKQKRTNTRHMFVFEEEEENISPIRSPFFPAFARFHRLDGAVPTSRKPEPRATKQPTRPRGGSSTQALSAYETNHLAGM